MTADESASMMNCFVLSLHSRTSVYACVLSAHCREKANVCIQHACMPFAALLPICRLHDQQFCSAQKIQHPLFVLCTSVDKTPWHARHSVWLVEWSFCTTYGFEPFLEFWLRKQNSFAIAWICHSNSHSNWVWKLWSVRHVIPGTPWLTLRARWAANVGVAQLVETWVRDSHHLDVFFVFFCFILKTLN